MEERREVESVYKIIVLLNEVNILAELYDSYPPRMPM